MGLTVRLGMHASSRHLFPAMSVQCCLQIYVPCFDPCCIVALWFAFTRWRMYGITSRPRAHPLNLIPSGTTPARFPPPVNVPECACMCDQTHQIHAGDQNAGGNATRGRKCVAMMVLAFFCGVGATIPSTASTAVTSGTVVRA